MSLASQPPHCGPFEVVRLDAACVQWRVGDRFCHSAPISLRLARGDVLNVQASNAEQASAFLALLGGRQPPAAGRYVLEGHELAAMSVADRRALLLARVGVRAGAPTLPPHLDTLENVMLRLLVNGVPRQDATARARAEMRALQIESLADTMPGRLTARQGALVRLASAIVHRPALLVCEHPEENLTEVEIAAVRNRLFDLATRDGVSIVLRTNHVPLATLAATTVWLKESFGSTSDSHRDRTDPAAAGTSAIV